MARRRPLTVFLLLAYGIGWPALMVPVVSDLPAEPFLLVLLYLALLGPALLVTRWADGPGAIRRLLGRTLIWRFGVGRWLVVVLAMPLLTLALAACTGTLEAPGRGWAFEAGFYLFNTLVFGALVANLWEETAWGGFVQTRLMARHGLLIGSLLTAPLFALIHVPLQLGGGATRTEAAYGILVVFLGAPFYRYLLGMHLMDTGGSILAIAVQHAAWNASGNLDAVRGEWQVVAAAVLLTFLVAARRAARPGVDAPRGLAEERLAAAGWLRVDPALRSSGRTRSGPATPSG
ncbi:CPBP family intramembrane glutamic endopeptidase [Nocardioides sp.]|uniref:CPBP family intramembrane glutamic endopeptidase n=1 Tax=Nocardioides sp. TaxID=35761 RepID=UPI002D805A1D|nr:CPBP family intramembrane glutamic endopeptidase [Nocardioides sp.]HET8959912.1 CPBP family intramembrane glutamic endopeptidase [Nocardioides sp.]